MGLKYTPAIDGLRAFAVLSVVVYHAGLPLAAGYVGVDVFFVISGYVITRMLLSEPRIDLAAFYARRVRRILPALVVVVAATLALSAAMLGPDARGDVTRSAVASAAMVPNLWFQFATGGYFDAASDEMPLLHLWSLGVEEQFYLLWPLLLMLRKRWLVAVLAVASFAGAVHFTQANQEAAFYQMPLRFWELAVGGFVAMLPKSRLGTFAALTGLGLLAFSVYAEPFVFPGMGAAYPVLGSALVLHAVHSGTRIAPLELAPVRYVGLISYSLYLWHWPLLALAKAYSLDPPTLQTNLALCALAFVLAALSYHLIEIPFRRTNAPHVRAIGLGIATCVALAGCAAAASAVTPATVSAYDRQDFPTVPGGGLTKGECHFQLMEAPKLPPASCGTGDVVLWGDSHAYAWRPYADTFGKVLQLTRAGCEPSAGHGAHVCQQFNALAVERAKQGKVVILAARWSRYGGRMQADLGSALDALSDVPRVVVLGPIPAMKYDPAKCIQRMQPERCGPTRAEFEAEAGAIRRALLAEVGKHPNAEYVEPVDYFCDATKCPLLRNGRSMYWDNDHITASAARGFTSSGTRRSAE